jgi:imidazolonepropionase-like amidohydrolase
MKRRLMVGVAAMAMAASSAAVPETVALVGATIVDGNGGQPVADGVVVLQGDRILAVGPRSSPAVPPGSRLLDVTGKWITPGLIDAHVHFFQSGGLYTRPDAIDLQTVMPYAQDLGRSKARLAETFARYLASGVTSVVDAGGPMWNFEVRRRANVSARAPRVAAAGPLIATEPTERQKRMDLGDPPIISATDAAHAQRLARAQLPHKPDFIKIWGIGSGAGGAGRVRDITRAVAEVAHAANIRVSVHATSLATAQAALAGGADILVHSVEDAPLPDSFVRQLKERGVVYVSTAMVREGYTDALQGRPELTSVERRLGAPDIIASLYEAPAPLIESAAERRRADSLPQILANAKMLVAAGGRLAAGTDAGNIGTVHGPAIHRELQLLALAGLTPAQVLTSATRDAAFAYSPRPDVGLVAPGYRADLLVLDADPLKSVGNVERIAQVWS